MVECFPFISNGKPCLALQESTYIFLIVIIAIHFHAAHSECLDQYSNSRTKRVNHHSIHRVTPVIPHPFREFQE